MKGFEAKFVDLPDGRVFTWQGGEGPLLLFLHATGMCASVYAQLLAPLTARWRVVACDARGHGRTELPLVERLDDWIPYRLDARALVEALGERPAVLVGHSFGATTLLEAVAETPALGARVVAIDPALVGFAVAAEWRRMRDAGAALPNPLAEQAARRRARFASVGEVRQAYHGRGVFRGWPEAALEGYLEGGLLPDGDGVKLACDPAWESLSYRGVSSTVEDSLKRLSVPLTLLAAEHGSPFLVEDEARVRELQPHAEVRRFAGTGHFLPVTHPELVLPYLLDAGA